VAVLRPAGVGADPAPAGAPAVATAFRVPVAAEAESSEEPGAPMRIRDGAVDVDPPAVPVGVDEGRWNDAARRAAARSVRSGPAHARRVQRRLRRGRARVPNNVFVTTVPVTECRADIDRGQGRCSGV
jgi:hypothetical protein